MTTKRLLRFAILADNFHADGTYKITVQGFPLLVFGCTDMERHFHPVGMMLSTYERTDDYEAMFSAVVSEIRDIPGAEIKPKVLMSDAAPAIRNGFHRVFPEDDVTYAMSKNIHLRILIAESLIAMEDLYQLQLSYNDEVFDDGSQIFVDKWIGLEPAFIANFETMYLQWNRFWYNGVSPRTPETNNALERFKREIKRNATQYNKKTMTECSSFRTLLRSMRT